MSNHGLNLDLSSLSICELVTVYRGLRHLSMTMSGLMGMPRSYAGRQYNIAGEIFETIAEHFDHEWSRVIDELGARQPEDEWEQHQRDFAIVDHHINETSPMHLNLEYASEQIGRKVGAI